MKDGCGGVTGHGRLQDNSLRDASCSEGFGTRRMIRVKTVVMVAPQRAALTESARGQDFDEDANGNLYVVMGKAASMNGSACLLELFLLIITG